MWSMTGFGKSSGVFNEKKYTVEIRSLNGKSLDLTLKIPPILRDLEGEFRGAVQEKLERGKVDFSVFTEPSESKEEAFLNTTLAKHYLKEIKQIAEEEGLSMDGWVSAILSLPGVIKQPLEAIAIDEQAFIVALANQALDETVGFREKEGAEIMKDLLFCLGKIDALLGQLEGYEEERIAVTRSRLEGLINEMKKAEFDSQRLEQELLFYMDKFDVSEEKQRLKSHLSFFEETASAPTSCGRKLGFIVQEMGREINTLGSKSNHAAMQRSVVEMKNFLEKIKEQIQNVL